MPRSMRIDFVSDVACPWCVIGLLGLEKALEEVRGEIEVELHFQPFELSPNLAPEGRNVVEHLSETYGSTPDEVMERRATVSDRAADLGFAMVTSRENRLYNTFDAHRLMHWASLQGRQQPLKHALFETYHGRNDNLTDADILVAAAEKAGLDGAAARAIIESDQYAQEVRRAEYHWQTRGVTGVPAAIVDERYVISGAQPPETYAKVLRQIAAQPQT
jgi:predicted DsbA family dithiol-disulfide isomerase